MPDVIDLCSSDESEDGGQALRTTNSGKNSTANTLSLNDNPDPMEIDFEQAKGPSRPLAAAKKPDKFPSTSSNANSLNLLNQQDNVNDSDSDSAEIGGSLVGNSSNRISTALKDFRTVLRENGSFFYEHKLNRIEPKFYDMSSKSNPTQGVASSSSVLPAMPNKEPEKDSDFLRIAPRILFAIKTHLGVEKLYTHQVETYRAVAHRGENAFLTTSFASGKSLAYTLPLLAAFENAANTNSSGISVTANGNLQSTDLTVGNASSSPGAKRRRLMSDSNGSIQAGFLTNVTNSDKIDPKQGSTSTTRPKAFLLFPTKALAQDQCAKLKKFEPEFWKVCTFDGDTPFEERLQLLENCDLFLTNPDTLHACILREFGGMASGANVSRSGGGKGSAMKRAIENLLRNLKFIVLDEAHVYTGRFGTNVCCVLRRLRAVLERVQNSDLGGGGNFLFVFSFCKSRGSIQLFYFS